MKYGFLGGFINDDVLRGVFRLLAKIADGFMKMQIVKIEFKEA